MLKNIKNWYLLKFRDTTREEAEPIEMTNLFLSVNMRLLPRIKLLFRGKTLVQLKRNEVDFIKNYNGR